MRSRGRVSSCGLIEPGLVSLSITASFGLDFERGSRGCFECDSDSNSTRAVFLINPEGEGVTT